MKILVTLFLIISSALVAQNKAVILIKSGKPINQEFRIVSITEPLLNTEKALGRIKFNQSQREFITLDFDEEVIPVLLKSTNFEKEVYLTPNDTITLIIEGEELTLNPINALNNAIEVINTASNDFFLRASKREGAPLPIKQTRGFCDSMRTHFKDTNNAYVRQYLIYKMAYVEISANARSRKEASKKYFNNNSIPLNNPVWCDAFITLYQGYFVQYLNSKKGVVLKGLFSEKKGWADILNEFSKDTFLFSSEIKKLVLIQGMNELFQTKQPNKQYYLSLLKDAKITEKSTEINTILTALIVHYSRFEVGNIPPKLVVVDAQSGKEINLSAIKGKAIYFCYYPLFNQLTQQEIIFLKGIYKKYQSKIEFVVVIDADPKTVEAASKNMALPFPMASSSSSSESLNDWLERKDVINYMLIHSNGKIYQAPAEGPETGVEAAFLGLIK